MTRRPSVMGRGRRARAGAGAGSSSDPDLSLLSAGVVMARRGRQNAIGLAVLRKDWKTPRNRSPLLSPRTGLVYGPLIQGASAQPWCNKITMWRFGDIVWIMLQCGGGVAL